MSTRLVLSIAAATAMMSSTPAFAASDGWRDTGNTAGSEFNGAPAGLTREQVRRDLEAARRDGSLRLTQRNANYPSHPTQGKTTAAGFVSSVAQRGEASRAAQPPASSDWRFIGGEAGWIYEGP